MLRASERDREAILAAIQREALEALTLEDLSTRVFPLVERAFDSSASLLYRCGDDGMPAPLTGTLREPHAVYTRQYCESDPIQTVLRRSNPWVLHGSRCPEWQEFRALPVYTEFSAQLGIDRMLHLRLVDAPHHGPGMAGIMLARSDRQPEFGELDTLAATRLLPTLELAMRRATRVEERLRAVGALEARLAQVEAILDASDRVQIALDRDGRLLWASPRAEELVELRPAGRQSVPETLVSAARRLGVAALPGATLERVQVEVPVARAGAAPLQAELRVARTRSGEPFIVAELCAPARRPSLEEAAARFRLTPSEAEVLALLGLGLSDREIARRRFVSIATVRTHVGRVLSKLGVRSRVQAVLVAQGATLPEPEP